MREEGGGSIVCFHDEHDGIFVSLRQSGKLGAQPPNPRSFSLWANRSGLADAAVPGDLT